MVAGEGQRRPTRGRGGCGERGKRYTCALMGYITHQLNVPKPSSIESQLRGFPVVSGKVWIGDRQPSAATSAGRHWGLRQQKILWTPCSAGGCFTGSHTPGGWHSEQVFPPRLCGSSFGVSRICGAGDGHEGCRVKAALESTQLPFRGGSFGSPLGRCLSEDLFVTGWGFGDQGGGRTWRWHHFLWQSGWLLATGCGA